MRILIDIKLVLLKFSIVSVICNNILRKVILIRAKKDEICDSIHRLAKKVCNIKENLESYLTLSKYYVIRRYVLTFDASLITIRSVHKESTCYSNNFSELRDVLF